MPISVAPIRRQYLQALVVFLAGSALTLFVFVLLRSAEMGEVRAEFARAAEVQTAALRRSTETNLLVLQSLHALYSAERDNGPTEFPEFVGPFLERLDGVRALEWIPRVTESERLDFEAKMRQGRLEDFEIRERDDDGVMRRASGRREYFPVSEAEPPPGNDSVIGFDLGSDATRLIAIERARDTGLAAATGRISLVQETEEGRHGFLVFMPTYAHDRAHDSVEGRRESLEGFILGVFQYPDLVEQALSYIPSSDIDLLLIDDSAPAEESLLYFHASPSSLEEGVTAGIVQGRSHKLELLTTFDVAGRQWSIHCIPSSKYLASGLSIYPFGLVGIGLAFSAMLSFYLLAGVRRTAHLADINARLRTEAEERKRAEEESEKLKGHLSQAKKMEAMGTLAGGIAHDFNNFLGAISGYAELAREKLPEGNEAHTDMGEILSISETAKNVIQEILTFSRPTRSKRTNVDPVNLLREVNTIVKVSLPSSVQIKEEIEEECGNIYVDPSRMKQVLMNLCTNGYQAMEDERGVLTLGLSDVRLSEEEIEEGFEAEEGDYCCFTVSDTGCGIPQEKMDRIFDPYYTTKSERRGTGLGLSIVHGIVKDFGGVIKIESVLGRGTQFQVLIPLTGAQLDRDDERPAVRKMDAAGQRILLVDDETHLLRTTSRYLEKFGYQVEAFDDPLEGLRAFEAAPEEFDLVFVDATMPEMTGIELAEAVRKIRAVRIVLASGNLDERVRQGAREVGIDHLIQKPFRMAQLGDLLGKAFSEGSGNEGTPLSR